MKTLNFETALDSAVSGISPIWWHFDGEHGILYCEVEKDGILEYHEGIAKIIPSEEYEGAWVGRTSSADFILWKDKELVSGNEVVAEVVDWKFRGKRNGQQDNEWGFCLYLAMDQCLHWIKDDDGREVELIGAYDHGAAFSDSIRLIVPLQNGHTLAIGEHGRWYFLFDEPIDQYEFEKEEKRRARTEAKILLAREKAELKALREQERRDKRTKKAYLNSLKVKKQHVLLSKRVKEELGK